MDMIFIHGLSWRGFDPNGCGLINYKYVAFTSYYKSEMIAPVRESFVGLFNIKSELKRKKYDYYFS